MKKLFVIIIVFALALALCACKKPVSEVTAPTAEPTEEVTPEPTEEPTPEPTEEPTPEPTEEPTPEPTATPVPTPMPTEVPVPAKPVPEGDYFAEVRAELPVIVDIDGDGEDDIVLISENLEDGKWVNGYRVTIDRACDPGNPFVWDTDDQSWAILGAIVDCDPETPAKQLVFWARMEDAGGATYAVRLKDDGSDFEVFVHPAEFFGGSAFYDGYPDDWVFHAEDGLPFLKRTEVFGTHFVSNRYTITANGFEVLDDEYVYGYEFSVTLKRKLEIKTDDGRTVTAKKGDKVRATATDLKTYVRVELEDGTKGTVELSFGEDGDWPIYINGIEEEEYADRPWAD